MEQITLIVSPSSIGTIQACARKYEYYKIRNIGTDGPKDEKLERGDLIHQVLDNYFSSKIADPEFPHEAAIEKAIEFGRYTSLEMNLEIEAIEFFLNVARNWLEYQHVHYFWKPLYSEAPFSILFYEDEGLKILLEGKIDLVIQLIKQPEIIAWTDHKTMAASKTLTPLSNQFLAYAYAFKDLTHHGFVNEIGIQKKEQKFKIQPLFYGDEVLTEWRENVIYHCKLMEGYIRAGFFPMNHNSCWLCQFQSICSQPPNLREKAIEMQYVQMKPHDLFEVKG